MKRTGTCNLCGECCGAAHMVDEAAVQYPPLPFNLFNWTNQEDIERAFPLAKIIAIPKPESITPSGIFKIRGKNHSFAWVPREGIVKSETNLECPFLMDNPGDGTRPCALHRDQSRNQDLHQIWLDMCNGVPYDKTPEDVGKWQHRHPGCSYEWVE